MDTKDTVLPSHSLDAEQAVLGVAFLSDSNFDTARQVLSASDFYDPRHQQIYKTLCGLIDKCNAPVDPMSVLHELDRIGMTEKCGGPAYITGLEQSVISPDNIGHHANIVRDCSFRRRASGALQKLTDHAASDISEPKGIAARAATLVDNLSRGLSFETVMLPEEIAKEAYDYLTCEDESAGFGVPTGLRQLDNMLYGLQPGDLVVLAARPSVGKTSLATQICVNAINHNIATFIISFEMSSLQITHKMTSQDLRIPVTKIRRKQTSTEESERVIHHLEQLSQKPLYMIHDPTASAEEIAAQCVAMKTKHPHLGLIIVDFLQLMKRKESSETKNAEIGEISRSLKVLAGKLKLPILLLSQLSRGVEKAKSPRAPILSDLRDSGEIEQNADIVMFLHRTSDQSMYTAMDTVDLVLAKGRNEAIGTCGLEFIKDITLFRDAPQREQEPPPGNYYDR